jgi:hypothetical protein
MPTPPKLSIVLPPEIDCPEIRQGLQDWVDSRPRSKKVTQTAMDRQIRRLVEWGKTWAIKALDHSIANGYQGIFPAPGMPLNPKQTAAAVEAATAPTRNKPASAWELRQKIDLLRSERTRLWRSDFESQSGRDRYPREYARCQAIAAEIRDLEKALSAIP